MIVGATAHVPDETLRVEPKVVVPVITGSAWLIGSAEAEIGARMLNPKLSNRAPIIPACNFFIMKF
jgi:hypothetical protein